MHTIAHSEEIWKFSSKRIFFSLHSSNLIIIILYACVKTVERERNIILRTFQSWNYIFFLCFRCWCYRESEAIEATFFHFQIVTFIQNDRFFALLALFLLPRHGVFYIIVPHKSQHTHYHDTKQLLFYKIVIHKLLYVHACTMYSLSYSFSECLIVEPLGVTWKLKIHKTYDMLAIFFLLSHYFFFLKNCIIFTV